MKKAYLFCSLFIFALTSYAQSKKINVLAYYSGNISEINNYDVTKLTHIIYSFCHLKGNEIYLGSAQIPIVKKLVSLKQKNARLKIQLALGGWGGCKTCSEVFSTKQGRDAFSASTKKLLDELEVDGIDLDWEYPAVQGPEGHQFLPEDKPNFTELVRSLRNTLGPKKEISFAAGAFPVFLEQAIEWEKVMPIVDRVHLMSYDLVNRNDDSTGHHTPLYSTPNQIASADYSVRYIRGLGIPADKLVIGMAFYGRLFETKQEETTGLYKPGEFKSYIVYREFPNILSTGAGYVSSWDSTAHAPYSYNKTKKMFATYDDEKSIAEKTHYAIDKGLNGVMFWELRQDKPKNGLLDVIHNTINHVKKFK